MSGGDKPIKREIQTRTYFCRPISTSRRHQLNWEIAWLELAWHYLHPEYPVGPEEGVTIKLQTTPIQGVTEACRHQVLTTLAKHCIFEHESDLMAYLT